MKKILILLVLLMPGICSAAVTRYTGHSVFNVNVDSSALPIGSVFVSAWLPTPVGSDTATYIDSYIYVKWPSYRFNSAGTLITDSTICWVVLTIPLLQDSIQPSAVVHWVDNNGYETKEPVFWGPSHVVGGDVDNAGSGLDTLSTLFVDRLTGRVTDTVWDGLQSARSGVAGSHGVSSQYWGRIMGTGVGPWTDSVYVLNGAAPIGNATVRAQPNGGGTFLSGNTDANGLIVFSTITDTLWLLAYAGGYNQTTVPDTAIVVTDTKDTVQMSAVSAGSPPSPSLTQILFYFYDGEGNVVKNVVLQYKLYSASNYVYHLDSTKVFDPSEWFEVRSVVTTGLATVNVVPNDSLLVAGGRAGETRWQFKAWSPESGQVLLGDDGIKLNVPASDTSLVYPRDRAAFGD